MKWLFFPKTDLRAFEDYAAYSVAGAANILSREWTRLAGQDENYRAVMHFGIYIQDQEHFFKVFANSFKENSKNYMILTLQTDGVTKSQTDGQLVASCFEGDPGSWFLEKSLTEACSLLLASQVHAL